MTQQKANLTDMVAKAYHHYVRKKNPPALMPNGMHMFRVVCEDEPRIRYDTVGLSIPLHLMSKRMLFHCIEEVMNPDRKLCDPRLYEYFSEIPIPVLQELQNVHNKYLESEAVFRKNTGPELLRFADKYDLCITACQSNTRSKILRASYLMEKGLSQSEACFYAGVDDAFFMKALDGMKPALKS